MTDFVLTELFSISTGADSLVNFCLVRGANNFFPVSKTMPKVTVYDFAGYYAVYKSPAPQMLLETLFVSYWFSHPFIG